MSQIKEKQEARDSGAWNELAPQQRQEMENGFRHMSMLARFHNIMGRKTIESLEMVTQHVKSIFVNGVMVDRVAAMLNYFLLHLVSYLQFISDLDQTIVQFISDLDQTIVQFISDLYKR